MVKVRTENMNGMDDINYFMQLIKGEDVHLVPSDVEFANGFMGKKMVTTDWAVAWEQDEHSNHITRMCLFHTAGIHLHTL